MARKDHTFIFKRSYITGISTIYILKNYRSCSMGDKTYFRRFNIFVKFNQTALPF